MTITQVNSPGNPSVGAIGDIPITSFTITELEALLEAAAYSLRMEQNLKHSLKDCSTHSMFDTEFLVELSFLEQSRDELLGLVGAIAHRLQVIEASKPLGEIFNQECLQSLSLEDLSVLLTACSCEVDGKSPEDDFSKSSDFTNWRFYWAFTGVHNRSEFIELIQKIHFRLDQMEVSQ